MQKLSVRCILPQTANKPVKQSRQQALLPTVLIYIYTECITDTIKNKSNIWLVLTDVAKQYFTLEINPCGLGPSFKSRAGYNGTCRVFPCYNTKNSEQHQWNKIAMMLSISRWTTTNNIDKISDEWFFRLVEFYDTKVSE